MIIRAEHDIATHVAHEQQPNGIVLAMQHMNSDRTASRSAQIIVAAMLSWYIYRTDHLTGRQRAKISVKLYMFAFFKFFNTLIVRAC
jgi:hypothetical protein